MAEIDQYGFVKGDREGNVKRLNKIIDNINEYSKAMNLPGVSRYIDQKNTQAMFPNAGASGTNVATDFSNMGALGQYMQPAMAIMDNVYKIDEPTQREKDINMGRMFLKFFTNMGAQASLPGATALGAGVQAGQLVAQDYLDRALLKEKTKKDREQAKKAGAVSLAMQLKSQKEALDIAKAKSQRGAPKTVEFGLAMKDGKPKLNADGEQLYTYNVYDPTGKIINTFEATRKSGVNVNVGKSGQKKFQEVFSTSQAKKFGEQLDASSAAVDGMQTIDTLLNLLADPDFETGPWEEFKVNLKAIGLSFGLFSNDDKTIDNIASAEAFRAKAYSIVLDSVSKMKGALSDKELGFLSAQGPTLSKTTEGNKLLLYLNKHQLDKAAKFRSFVIEWSDKNNDGQFPQDGATYNRMIDDWKNSDAMKLNPYEYIKGEAEKFEQELILGMGGEVDNNGELVPGSLDSDSFKEQEKIKQIVDQVANKFSLRLLKKVFKNSGFM